jgi:hypothetical protein
VARTTIIPSAARLLTDQLLLTRQSLFNFYANNSTVLLAFPLTLIGWWDNFREEEPHPSLDSLIQEFRISASSFDQQSEDYMAQAQDRSSPSTHLLAECVVRDQASWLILQQRRKLLEQRLDVLEEEILSVVPDAQVADREAARLSAEIVRDWRLGIY